MLRHLWLLLVVVVTAAATAGLGNGGRITLQPPECPLPFAVLGSRCIAVEPFVTGSHDEMQYQCERYGGTMLELADPDDYWTVLQYLQQEGLTSHDYWLGASVPELYANAYWLKSNRSVPMGTPLWAINDGYYSSDPYEQEPNVESYEQRVYMRAYRKLLLAAMDPDENVAGTICERPFL